MTAAQTYLAVQSALIDALEGAVAGLSPVPAVHDCVPPSGGFPRIVLDSSMTDATDALTALRDTVTVYLSIWSRHEGQSEVMRIGEAIRAGLHDGRLALAAGTCFECKVVRFRTARDVDEKTFQGLVTLRLRIARGTA